MVVERPSDAMMHGLHYVAGLVFYSVTPVAVVCESVPPFGLTKEMIMALSQRHAYGLSLFIAASVTQYHIHAYLASLKPRIGPRIYILPKGGLFDAVLCPHYFLEILIYAALFMAVGTWTTFAVLVWVVVDLSVSADESYKWYLARFGDKLNPEIARIIPFVF
ncbi:hypothetical protein SmJEL517_g00038 [Synchytrium microbalum]|uniref:3-oxo-5-alpha-steroid 4-dehydrogenase C-terminal domain-containing protein n=1 Tax=Synchytrium microbalum TaxID=1806994 RepID=A0A507CGC4_9FUNG|nr:uncharacterized protein SmJEL517_g00038 [Synchytrium microbalum]TPX38259.1 hypothetical protein SmJEL517_g00038 [Synchytrium microbalum]